MNTVKNIHVFLLDEDNKIPINGNSVLKKNRLYFTPDLPFIPSAKYVLVSNKSEYLFSLEPKNKRLPSVSKIYPTSDILPENLLRIYIQFSEPMRTDNNLKSIKLYDENHQEIKGAIFNNVQELWDTSQKQLTLIFDPSRVKTGLIAHKSLGRALEGYKTYYLKINPLKSVSGKMMAQATYKRFKVSKADFNFPDISNWKIDFPKKNTKNALKIDFYESIDIMSLYHRISVYDKNNNLVLGNLKIGDGEKTWSFFPEKPWKKHQYFIRINSRLSDPSGNNLNGLFDHKIGSLKNKKEGNIVTIPFYIK
ncbi:hypothetical protein [Tenacibaculum xiamenense]|uniref:hypothetical protein n=1 Tax=Tenacibaculum xiamenense TaxID=1261553 RepID=UPI0038B4F9FF